MQFLEASGAGRVLKKAKERAPDTFTLSPGQDIDRLDFTFCLIELTEPRDSARVLSDHEKPLSNHRYVTVRRQQPGPGCYLVRGV